MSISAVITNNGYNFWRDSSSGANNAKITYIALGTGNSTPIATQTKLDAEVFRKAIASWTNGASVGEILVNGYIGPADALSVVIAEVAIFGGSSAGPTANSGIMIARALWSHTRPSTASESLLLPFDLVF